MQNQSNIFEVVSHLPIKSSTIRVSPEGLVNDIRGIHKPSYLSSNGYMYEFVQTFDDRLILFPFDIIMATTFVPVPKDLIGKKLKVRHKNGILADCCYLNLEWVEDIEEWRDIDFYNIKPGYYRVSNHGRIRSMSTDPPKIMKTVVNKYGYQRINLKNETNGSLNYSVHRLVGIAFVEGYKPDLQINHIDGCKLNNNWNNLEWVTGSENIKHAFMLNLTDYNLRKIDENAARKICLSLNKNNGLIINTYNELKDSIPGLTYPIIGSIKYGDTFVSVADRYLTDAGRKKQIRQTDPDVILDVSCCLKKHNGDVKKTKKELDTKYPWISYGWIWHLKDKSVSSEITDLVFKKDEFPKVIPLTENDAITIIKCLLKHRGDPYVNQTVFNELKDVIPGLSKDKVRAIKDKKSWKELSDKYFSRDEF